MKAILDIFRRADLLQQSYKASIEMLETDLKMFKAACKSLRRSENGEITIDIYAEDAKINQYERDIRSKVLVHMATTPTKDVVFGLILVSIVIDIERIGDYTKNILELAVNHPSKLNAGEFEEQLCEIEDKVDKRFDILIEAFKISDTEAARSIMRGHRAQTKRCDNIVHSLIQKEHPEMTGNDAVTLALYLRYLKRVSSHITNIASGIVNPFDRIGFQE